MGLTDGIPDVRIGLIDGPVAIDHPDLAGQRMWEIGARNSGACTRASSAACRHGTFVAGMLSARRGSAGAAICPGCTLLVRPIFSETAAAEGEMPSVTPVELASAILDCIGAGARVLNISAALARPSTRNERVLEDALGRAGERGAIVVAAAGNQGTLGSTTITRHPSVIPVVAYDREGRPMNHSNLASSIGRRGLGAPGDRITSLGIKGRSLTLGGTSAATPFVTGAIALLWSQFPVATATRMWIAVVQACAPRRASVVPPLLDAWAAYQALRG
jgi:subtilisin family serine protease